ncbi:MAG TPA: hypothetical protein VOA64_19300 [Candidatus Dormibacteraeota bacterium]|nr:hypothetical protein [Candidatus Dormibacteraeota bacterium]
MKRKPNPLTGELKLAKRIWGDIAGTRLTELRHLLQRYKLSVALGEVIDLDNHWYVTHSGLIRLATRRRCDGIRTTLQQRLSDPAASRWVFRATVYKSPGSRGFVGYGDADPSNVSTLVHGAEMRIAETRAVNRALRKAYGIGLCSVEELGSLYSNRSPASDHAPSATHSSNGSNNGQPRLRDQLCLLIRQHNLDPTLVKAYAADFCGTPSLKEANRDLVQSFISHLTACAKEDRNMLICRLNSYAQPVEVKA